MSVFSENKTLVFLDKQKPYYYELRYIVQLLFFNSGIEIELTNERREEAVIIDETDADIIVSADFYSKFIKSTAVLSENDFRVFSAKNDLLFCFWLVNSHQEINASEFDKLGRYPYKTSIQARTGTATVNTVQNIFDNLFQSVKKLNGKKNKFLNSRVFLSHDIDNVYNAWLEDGFYAFKKFNPLPFFSLAMKAILGRPEWLNIDKILKIHTEYDMKSAFFWIVNKGRTKEGLANADYSIDEKKIRDQIQLIKQKGFESALHKSVSADTFETELKKLKIPVNANRNHYLRFNLSSHYKSIEHSGLHIDCSLGFAEQFGFRNSYGQPFQPYNSETKEAFKFIEVPLHIMDRTFYSYMHIPAQEASRHIIHFLEKNNKNCILSILWHNNFFSSIKYGGYLEVYKKILEYCYESGLKSISLKEIDAQFRMN